MKNKNKTCEFKSCESKLRKLNKIESIDRIWIEELKGQKGQFVSAEAENVIGKTWKQRRNKRETETEKTTVTDKDKCMCVLLCKRERERWPWVKEGDSEGASVTGAAARDMGIPASKSMAPVAGERETVS